MKIISFKLFFFASLIFFTNYFGYCIDNDPSDSIIIEGMVLEPEYGEVIEVGTIYSIKFYLSVHNYGEGSVDSIIINLAKDIGENEEPVDPVKIGSLQYSSNVDTYTYLWNTSSVATGTWYIVVETKPTVNYFSTKIKLILSAPKVTTSDVTEITGTTAICGGTIIYNGPHNIAKRGVIWSSDNESPDLDNNEGKTVDGSGTGTFTSLLTELDKASYYVRAYAINSDGTVYGDVKHFNTDKKLPAVSIDDVGDITAHTAIAGGIITDDGDDPGNITAGIVWSEAPNPTIDNNDGIYTVPEKLSKDMTFIAYLSSLKENSYYHIIPYASNNAGTAYGEELEINTGSFQVQSGTFTDTRDDKQYRTVTIYEQIWMAENLAYLPQICPHNENCGYWVYGYDGLSVDDAKSKDNYTSYGVLYSWNKAQTACPDGWHLPTSDEWSTLEMYLGMDYNTAHNVNNTSSRGNNEGGMLKEADTNHWSVPNAGANNVTGFYAVPGGRKTHNSAFYDLTNTSYFWTNTTTGTSNCIIYRYLKYDSENIFSYCDSHTDSNSGFSVRCVKD